MRTRGWVVSLLAASLLLTGTASAEPVARTAAASAAPCTQHAMNRLVGPKSSTSLTAQWWACRHGFAVAAGRGSVGWGVVVAKSVDGKWVTKRGLDDGSCQFADPYTECQGYYNSKIGISQAHLLDLVYAAGLTVTGNVAITPPQPRHHRTYYAQGAYTPSPARRPSGVQVSGDGTLFLKKVHWRRWSRTRAVGIGVSWVDNCRPSCAEGTFEKRRGVKILLSKPTKCEKWVFDGLVLRWTQRKSRYLPRRVNLSPYIRGCQ